MTTPFGPQLIGETEKTLNPKWQNSRVIGGYDDDVLRRLKDEVDGDLYTSGSGTLVRAMVADQLVDELQLSLYPLTRRAGPRLFPEGAAPQCFELAASDAYARGVMHLAYRRSASE